MYGIDWRLAAIIVVIFLGIYSVAIRKFFNAGGDWRIFLPLVGLLGIACLIYFAYSLKEVKFTNEAIFYGIILTISITIASLASMLVYADAEAELSIAMPVMSLAMVSTALLSILFLSEVLTLKTVVGMALAFISIVILSWK